MRVDIRIRTILLVEKIKDNPVLAKKLEIRDASYFKKAKEGK